MFRVFNSIFTAFLWVCNSVVFFCSAELWRFQGGISLKSLELLSQFKDCVRWNMRCLSPRRTSRQSCHLHSQDDSRDSMQDLTHLFPPSPLTFSLWRDAILTSLPQCLSFFHLSCCLRTLRAALISLPAPSLLRSPETVTSITPFTQVFSLLSSLVLSAAASSVAVASLYRCGPSNYCK